MSSDHLRQLLQRCGEPTDGDEPVLQSRLDQALRVLGKRKRLIDLSVSLDCPVCMEPVAPPIFQCNEGHIICEDCKKRVTTCPECRAPLGTCRARLLERIVEPLLVECPNAGCGEWVALGQLRGHREGCVHHVVAVRCVQCTWYGPCTSVIAHFTECHPSSMGEVEEQRQNIQNNSGLVYSGLVYRPFNDDSTLNVDLDWIYEMDVPALLMIRDKGNALSVCVALLAPDAKLYRWNLTIANISVSGVPLPPEALTDDFDPHKQAAVVIPVEAIRQIVGDTCRLTFTFRYSKERLNDDSASV